jgi:hypothetical protein
MSERYIWGESLWAETVKHSQVWIFNEVSPGQIGVYLDTYTFGTFRKEEMITMLERVLKRLKEPVAVNGALVLPGMEEVAFTPNKNDDENDEDFDEELDEEFEEEKMEE